MLVVIVATAALLGASTAGNAVTPAALATLADGAAAARARYLEGDFAGAARAAEDVAGVFVGACGAGATGCAQGDAHGPAFFAEPAAWDAWADAQATKALALYRQNDDAAADAVFGGIIITRPAWIPDRGFIPPKPLARFDALREQLLASKTVPVVLAMSGIGDPVVDGRIVSKGTPIDVLPGVHYIGVVGLGRVVDVREAMHITVGTASASSATTSSVTTSTTTTTTTASTASPPAVVNDEGGTPWGLIVGVGIGVVVVAGASVAAVIALQPGEAAPNPGGTTVFIDASTLKR
jgi:hypothetical protein